MEIGRKGKKVESIGKSLGNSKGKAKSVLNIICGTLVWNELLVEESSFNSIFRRVNKWQTRK